MVNLDKVLGIGTFSKLAKCVIRLIEKTENKTNNETFFKI
jgi:hypothetical protein